MLPSPPPDRAWPSAQAKLPIYALPVLNGKIYVVTAPDLVAAVSRSSKAITFNPFISEVGCRLTGADASARAIIEDNVNLERGNWGYVVEVHDQIVASMAQGSALLEAMSRAMAKELEKHFEALDADDLGHEVDLYAWLRHAVTLRSSTAIYGPRNPLLTDPGLEDEWWAFERASNTLLLDVVPWLLAPRGHRGRAQAAAAFQRYHEGFEAEGASAYIQARANTNRKYGMSYANAGRLEVGTLIGVLVNTVPSAFYLLSAICRDAALLHDVRAELQAAAVADGPANSSEDPRQRVRSLHAPALMDRERCPLLHSAWQETLRLHARGASARLVVEETRLGAEQWLLAKGSVVIVPQAALHTDPAHWGGDAGAFDPRRFLKTEGSGVRDKAAAVYRPFGGGSTICPGRFFVKGEVLMLVAMMVMRYEIKPVSERGEWKVPKPKQTSLTQNVFPPDGDVKVRITLRQEARDVKWEYTF